MSGRTDNYLHSKEANVEGGEILELLYQFKDNNFFSCERELNVYSIFERIVKLMYQVVCFSLLIYITFCRVVEFTIRFGLTYTHC